MNSRFKTGLATVLLCLLSISAQAASISYPDHEVGSVNSGDTRPCAFFTLNAVGVADATLVAGSPWFALSHANANYKAALAALMLAKATGKRVYVSTTGNVACGHVEVHQFVIN